MWKQFKFSVSEHNHVGEVRRLAQNSAKALEFDDILTGKVSIVVTELATNIVKHAASGEIIIVESNCGLHVLAIDKGPGITNLENSMTDGVSTGGTAGNGLGAIKRNSTCYDLFTAPAMGAVFYVSFCKDTQTGIPVGAICTPYPGESVAGDSWDMKEKENSLDIILADGLGHGLLANDASKLACNIFLEEELSGEKLMPILHRALRPTRGAAVSIVNIDLNNKTLKFCGVGNVSGGIKSIGTPGKKCVSYNGTVGVQIHKFQELSYPFDKGDVFVIASDGISTQWDLQKYPGIMRRHPFVIAGILYRDFGKDTDDATVIVVKEEE